MPRKVALVTHAVDGGVRTVLDFIYRVATEENYAVDLFLLSTSMRDKASVRILSPSTWLQEPRIISGELDGRPLRHVGAVLTEFEFQRYQPRNILTEVLDTYDLVQVVGGGPAWGNVARNVRVPVCVFAATTTQQERVSIIAQTKGFRKAWLAGMTFLVSRIEREGLNAVDCIFAESNYTKDLLVEVADSKKIFLAPPGVDTEFFAPPPVPPHSGFILSVGRFRDPRKNVRLLFEAYCLLCKVLPRAPRLVLAGRTGISAVDLEYAQTLGINDRLQLFENVTLEDLRVLYQRASLFILSSNEEGLGIVLLEAMASGLPVISTDCGGPSTAIVHGKTGLLTPVGDVQALADAMQMLIENPDLRRQMGSAGRAITEKKFSLAAAGQVYLDKYAELLHSDLDDV